jgi:hypothetical protein
MAAPFLVTGQRSHGAPPADTRFLRVLKRGEMIYPQGEK